MSLLNRKQVLTAIDERKKDVETVPVPEWGGEVGIRRLSAADLDKAGFFGGGEKTTIEIARSVLSMTLCDENGERLFSDQDIAELDEADVNVTLKLFNEAARINGLLEGEMTGMVASFSEAQPGDTSSR